MLPLQTSIDLAKRQSYTCQYQLQQQAYIPIYIIGIEKYTEDVGLGLLKKMLFVFI